MIKMLLIIELLKVCGCPKDRRQEIEVDEGISLSSEEKGSLEDTRCLGDGENYVSEYKQESSFHFPLHCLPDAVFSRDIDVSPLFNLS